MDAIDLSTVNLLRSVDPRDWPVTTAITAINVTPNNITFDFSKKDGADRWPSQPFGKPEDGGNCQYTVWLFLQLGGQWFGAAFIQMWFGRDGVGDSISDFPNNWYDRRNFWPAMTGHVVVPGETIGFMVTAGNARLEGASSVHERSNVVTIAAPAGDMGLFTFPAVAPVPVPTPPAPPLGDNPQALLEAALKILDAIVENTGAVVRLSDKIAEFERAGVRVHF